MAVFHHVVTEVLGMVSVLGVITLMVVAGLDIKPRSGA